MHRINELHQAREILRLWRLVAINIDRNPRYEGALRSGFEQSKKLAIYIAENSEEPSAEVWLSIFRAEELIFGDELKDQATWGGGPLEKMEEVNTRAKVEQRIEQSFAWEEREI